MRLLRWLGLLVAALVGAVRRRRREAGPTEPIVPPGEPRPRAELALAVLLVLATLGAIAFIVVYADDAVHNRTQWLGVSLGLALAFLAAALIVVGQRLVVTEEIEEEYPDPEGHVEDQAALVQLVSESTSRFTRKRLLKALTGLAGGSLGLALLSPVVSLGPIFDTESLFGAPWRRGRRLVDETGKPLKADDIEAGTFYTAYPEHADRKQIGAPVIVVRLDPKALKLPAGRNDWAPEGILAYSKICTHAGCAIALYRKPTFTPTEPRPAFVCPCHYSTFDPATGGSVIFGPAGRALPQLPLSIDRRGVLRAAGDFSGPVGPSFAGVRRGRARTPS